MRLILFFLFISCNASAMEQPNNAEDPKYDELIEWVEKGDDQQVKKLLAEGVQAQDTRAFLYTINSYSPSLAVLEELVKSKIYRSLIDERYEMNGVTPLIFAIDHNNLPAVKLLLKYGASVNKTNKTGHSPLIYALEFRRDFNVIPLLLACPVLDILKKVPSEKDGGYAMLSALQIAKERSRIHKNAYRIMPNLQISREYQRVGRMILMYLQPFSSEGRVARSGLFQTGLPLDILKKIAASVDYEAAEKEFKF